MITETQVATEVEAWQGDVDRLFGEIRNWLSEAEIRASGSDLEPAPTIRSEPMVVNEGRSGPYPIEQLVVTYLGSQMTVRPVARWVVGADGRVDILGSEGPIILVDLRHDGGWHYLPDSPTRSPLALTGDLFRQLAASCLR